MDSMTPSLELTHLSDPHVVPGVWGVLETPVAPGPHPGVVLVPGSSGWKPVYPQIAKALADAGLAALAIDYYAETGSDTSSEDRLAKWPQWQATIRNAVAYLQASPSVSGRPVGLVGYSRGSFLAVSVAASILAVKAVVDVFGGGNPSAEALAREVIGFPPLLILHGEADTVVPVTQAHRLREAVLAHGGDVEMHLYPGAEHAFSAPWSPAYLEAEAADSLRRTIEFLRRRLGA